MSVLHDLLVLLGLAHDDPPVPLQVKLFDPLGQPMASAPFLITVDGEKRPGTTNATGLASAGNVTDSGVCNVQWRRSAADYPADLPPLGPDDFEFSLDVTLSLDRDQNKATAQRLQNLGYFGGPALANNVSAFQKDHDLPVTGDPTDTDFQAKLIADNDGAQPDRTAFPFPPVALPEEE